MPEIANGRLIYREPTTISDERFEALLSHPSIDRDMAAVVGLVTPTSVGTGSDWGWMRTDSP